MSVLPPRPKMPQLGALRAFEAAARLGSFVAASAELFVTPAAIAQQVKNLEDWAGAKLFKRHAQGIELTPLGASVAADFELAFDGLGQAVQNLRTRAAPQEVRIAALPSIAQLWLSPRLPAIRNALPDISISVSAVEQKPNLSREPFDLAVFYQENSAENDENTIIVGPDVIYPVCTPEIAAVLTSVSSLRDSVFLHDTAWKGDWAVWLKSFRKTDGAGAVAVHSGPEFSLYALAVEECKNGAGVLIGHDHLVRPHLTAGVLVKPFDAEAVLPRNLAIFSACALDENPVIAAIAAKLLA